MQLLEKNMYNFLFSVSEGCFKFENEIICVKYRNNKEILKLLWVETNTQYQNLGHASNILNHIVDTILKPDQTFMISAPDFDTYSFYYHWLEKRGLCSDKIDVLVEEDDTGFTFSLPYSDLHLESKNSLRKKK